jgi:hypothetical protein
VIVAIMTHNALSAGNYKNVMIKNLPVSDEVEPQFMSYIAGLPAGIRNQLLPLQEGNPNAVTPAALLRQYNQQQTDYLHALTEGIVPLLNDDRKTDALQLVNDDGSNWSKQVVAGTYIQDGDISNAENSLAAIDPASDPYTEANIELLNQLLQLKLDGVSLYDINPTTFNAIYQLANECPPYPAVYNARAIVEMLTGEKIAECPVDENWKMNSSLEVKGNTKESLLGENYPDPFNDLTNIPVSVPEGSKGKLEVTDITGRILYTRMLTEGKQTLELNTEKWEQGMYFYSLELDGILIDSRKMILVK